MPSLQSSSTRLLKSLLSARKGSDGSSNKNSKPLKNYYSKQFIYVNCFGLLVWPSGRLFCASEVALTEAESPLCMEDQPLRDACESRRDSSSKSSIIRKFFGWRCSFALIVSYPPFWSLTQLRRTPILSYKCFQKSKPNCSANLNWQQQSSRLFLLTPSILAAYCRLTFLRWLFGFAQVRCSPLQRFTRSMASATVLQRLRISFRSVLLAQKFDSLSQLPQRFGSFCRYRTKITVGSIKYRAKKPFWAPSLRNPIKSLAVGSQTVMRAILRGQYLVKMGVRSTGSFCRSISKSTMRDCMFSSFSNTKVFKTFQQGSFTPDIKFQFFRFGSHMLL